MGIVERIKTEGKKLGLSIATIEKETGLGNGTIRRWDKSIPSCDKLYSVAKLLHVSLDYLYTGDEENNSIIFSQDIEEFIQIYSMLSEEDKKICYKIMQALGIFGKKD